MMETLIKWAKNNIKFFEKESIRTVNIHIDEISAYVDHESDSFIGRIVINSEGHIEIEVYEIVTGVKIMYANYNFQKSFNNDILIPYIRILKGN